MKFDVIKISDLLPLNATSTKPVAISSLANAELKQYLEVADKFIDEWRKANPEGMRLRLQIQNLNMVPNRDGRVAIVVKPSDDFNSTAFTYPVSVANVIANNLGLPSFPALASVIAATTNDPSFVELTINLVKKGEQYTRTDGTVSTYKAPTAAVVGREEVKLSASALRRIANLTAEVDKAEMLAFRQGLLHTAAPVAVAAATADDNDVIGG